MKQKYIIEWKEKESSKSISKQLEKHYDIESNKYDKIAINPKDPWYKEMVVGPKEFIKLINTKKNEKILDCACGTGRVTIGLAKKGAKVYAFDISNGMLNKLKENLKERSYKKNVVEIKKASLERIPYEDKFFDKVVCRGTLDCFHPKHYMKFIKEMKRVLKLKGDLIIDLPWPEGKLGKLSYNPKKCWSLSKIKNNFKKLGLIIKKRNDIGMCHQLVFKNKSN